MSRIKYRVGNIFTQLPTDDTMVVIPHIVNNVGGFGAGFVLHFAKTFPKAKESYFDWVKGNIKAIPFELGQSMPAKIGENRIAHHMCAQNGVIGPNNPKPIKYRALANCLHKVNNLCGSINVEIHAPAFGSDLSGGDWYIISTLIDEILISPVKIYIYTLTQEQQDKLLK